MKALEEKRDKLIDKLCVSSDVSMIKGFNLGWDACAKEYEQENAEIKRKLEIAKEALEFYGERNNWKCFDSHSEVKDVITVSDISAKNHIKDSHYMIASGGNRARVALKEVESAGE